MTDSKPKRRSPERSRKDPVRIRGVRYASATAAAKRLGVTVDRIMSAARQGRLNMIGIHASKTRTRGGPIPYPVSIRGVVYPSAVDAAKALGLSEGTVRSAVSVGRTDFVGLGRSRTQCNARKGQVAHTAIPVKIGKREWTSRQACARELGVGRTALRRRLEAGDVDWLMRKIMAADAKRLKEAEERAKIDAWRETMAAKRARQRAEAGGAMQCAC